MRTQVAPNPTLKVSPGPENKVSVHKMIFKCSSGDGEALHGCRIGGGYVLRPAVRIEGTADVTLPGGANCALSHPLLSSLLVDPLLKLARRGIFPEFFRQGSETRGSVIVALPVPYKESLGLRFCDTFLIG